MSAPDDDKNPWLSLHGLLLGENKISVGVLATAIEAEGIQTYDRFGRRISANGDSPESPHVKEEALDLLAEYYDGICRGDPESEEYRNNFFLYEEHPMLRFGWSTDEAPNFSGYESETPPQAVMASNSLEKVPRSDARYTYLILLAVLFKEAEIDVRGHGTAGIIAHATELLGSPVSEQTVRNVLNGITEAIEYRKK